MIENLIGGIQRQCNRVRNEVIPDYEEIGAAGQFGLIMLRQSVAEGEAAIASGDTVRMLAAYKDLEDCQ